MFYKKKRSSNRKVPENAKNVTHRMLCSQQICALMLGSTCFFQVLVRRLTLNSINPASTKKKSGGMPISTFGMLFKKRISPLQVRKFLHGTPYQGKTRTGEENNEARFLPLTALDVGHQKELSNAYKDEIVHHVVRAEAPHRSAIQDQDAHPGNWRRIAEQRT